MDGRMTERILHKFDLLVLMPVLLLIGFGLLTLYSVGHVPEDMKDSFQPEESQFFSRQLIWVALGIAVMITAMAVPFRNYESAAVLVYIVGVVLLVVTFLQAPAKGANRWIVIGGFNLQPSEFMKIATIFLLARFLSEKKNDPNKIRVIAISMAIVALPTLLVMRQPDLGTAIVFPALLLPILYWRGLNEGIIILLLSPVISAALTIYSSVSVRGVEKYPFPLLIFFMIVLLIAYRRRRYVFQSSLLVALNLSVMLAVPNIWDRLQLYQQKRILDFMRPESDILGSGWQVYQSKVAIGSGGFFGKQYLHGTQKLLAFLPERHSDFIYSVLSEELGFIGAFVILVLYGLLILRGYYLATQVKNRFASIAAIGICSYFAFHVMVNIGMTLGLAPVTGLPLPFLSYGGSSMLISCFLAGALMNFSMRFYEY
jgi:rod shape determining protein RodA